MRLGMAPGLPGGDSHTCPMGEDTEEERARRRRLKEAVPAAILGAAGARIGGVAGAAMAAGLVPYGVEFFGKVLSEFGEDAQRRAQEMMTSTADTMGCEPDELTEKAM